jgi:hypothetical protein
MKTYWGSGGIGPHSLWTRHYIGVRGQLHAPAALFPGKEPPVPIVYEAGWAPEPFWTRCRREKFLPPRREATVFDACFVCLWKVVSCFEGIKIFENNVLIKISGPRRNEASAKFRMLHNHELCGVYTSRLMLQNTWRCTSTPLYVLMVRGKPYFYLRKFIRLWWDACGSGEEYSGLLQGDSAWCYHEAYFVSVS